ncbi:hypothetical protein BH24ACT15_BH24ACT15_36380 [soil metagenome]
MHQLIPNDAGMEELLEKRKGPEIHSAKSHRCVDKVGAKGHDESSSWAICTASMGADAVYAKGHGGSARPKRRMREAVDPLSVDWLSVEDIFREEQARHR